MTDQGWTFIIVVSLLALCAVTAVVAAMDRKPPVWLNAIALGVSTVGLTATVALGGAFRAASWGVGTGIIFGLVLRDCLDRTK